MSAEEIKRVLEKSGYKNIPPDLLRDFMRSMEEEDDEDDVDRIDEEEEEVQEFRPLRRPQKKHVASPPKKVQKRQSPSPPPVKEVKRTSVRQSPVRETRRTKVEKNEDQVSDDETAEFEDRIQALRDKASELDKTLAECRNVVLASDDEDDEQGDVDVPLYYGTSERKLDPYPVVKKEFRGGFIRPPQVKPSKKPTGAAKKKGRRLLYEERHPESSYVPPPERRRDALRWSIRQKLIYSHPDYHK